MLICTSPTSSFFGSERYGYCVTELRNDFFFWHVWVPIVIVVNLGPASQLSALLTVYFWPHLVSEGCFRGVGYFARQKI